MELGQLLADIRSRLAQLNLEIISDEEIEFHHSIELNDSLQILVSLEDGSIYYMDYKLIDCMNECDNINQLFSNHFKAKEV